jgi:hypothetical protein
MTSSIRRHTDEDWSRKLRKLRRQRRKRNRIDNAAPKSVRTVSGGLPSLGRKR